jgi:chromatin modification-related protein YNG2
MLAEQLIQFIRMRSKLDVDIVKVRTLREPPDIVASITRPLPSVLPTLGAEAFGVPGGNPTLAISDRVVSAAASLSPSLSGPMIHVKQPCNFSDSFVSLRTASQRQPRSRYHAHTQQKSRLSQQVHLPPEYSKSDTNGEGDDMEEGKDEDEPLYCFC